MHEQWVWGISSEKPKLASSKLILGYFEETELSIDNIKIIDSIIITVNKISLLFHFAWEASFHI